MATEDPESEKGKREFINALNRHGYAFQQAVAERVAQLGKAHKTTWAIEAIEFPVAVQEAATSIDLVLQAGPTSTYLVGECKRVDPALGRWCFARTPTRGTESLHHNLILEQLVYSPSAKLHSTPFAGRWSTAAPCNLPERTLAKADLGRASSFDLPGAHSEVGDPPSLL
jgi:hypothetical protein